jgi:FkbM family methyltransferase
MRLKRLASLMPPMMQQELRRWKVWLDFKRGKFAANDPEFHLLPRLVQPGDWVLDIGANVGYYSMRLSELVGRQGHVFAFEPIGSTVEVLTFIARFARHENITIFNTAASDQTALLRFSIPTNQHGLPDYFCAMTDVNGGHNVFATTVDSLAFPQRIAYVKIDTEGAENSVLRGMEALIERDHPILSIEGDESLQPYLALRGYRMCPRKPGSPNLLFLPSQFTANLD